jgi:hypothetical protein
MLAAMRRASSQVKPHRGFATPVALINYEVF